MRMTVDQAFKAAVEHPSQAAFDDLAEAIESSVQEHDHTEGNG